jgi:hypothetical protein
MHLKQLRRRQRCKQRRCKTTGTHAKKAHLLEMLELTPNHPDNLGATKMNLHDRMIQNQIQFAKKNDRSIVCFFSPSFFCHAYKLYDQTVPQYTRIWCASLPQQGNGSLQMTILYNRDGQGMFVALQNHG